LRHDTKDVERLNNIRSTAASLQIRKKSKELMLSLTRKRDIVVWVTLVHEFSLFGSRDIMRGSKMTAISPEIKVFYSQALEWLQIPTG
jgi:hypothetical protein